MTNRRYGRLSSGATTAAPSAQPKRFNGATTARSWNSRKPLDPVEASNRLQWGHDRAVVEFRFAGGMWWSNPLLQWGHDRAVVELGADSFVLSQIISLQWGHDRAVVEL